MPPSDESDRDSRKPKFMDTLHTTIGDLSQSSVREVTNHYIYFTFKGQVFSILVSAIVTKPDSRAFRYDNYFRASDVTFKGLEAAMADITGLKKAAPGQKDRIHIYVLNVTPFQTGGYLRVSSDLEVATYLSKYFDAVENMGVKVTTAYWVVKEPGQAPPTMPVRTIKP